jgi:XTP/dITP diphosphohydrolase
MDIIIASNNKGKIVEYKAMLEPLGYNVMSQSEAGVNIEVEETGTTFEENAFLKANAIYQLKHTAVLADDSGLEVEYLNGEPGIYSARYKGLETSEERRRCVLEQMEGLPMEQRKARFVCSICFIKQNGEKIVVNGIYNGYISNEERGDNGFGYDPIFIPEGRNTTVAEISKEEKNSESHRAIALKKLAKELENIK